MPPGRSRACAAPRRRQGRSSSLRCGRSTLTPTPGRRPRPGRPSGPSQTGSRCLTAGPFTDKELSAPYPSIRVIDPLRFTAFDGWLGGSHAARRGSAFEPRVVRPPSYRDRDKADTFNGRRHPPPTRPSHRSAPALGQCSLSGASVPRWKEYQDTDPARDVTQRPREARMRRAIRQASTSRTGRPGCPGSAW